MPLRKKYFTHKRYLPCRLCTKFSVKEYLRCYVCAQYFHRDCAKLSKRSYENMIKNKINFICSNRCYNLELPFFPINNELEFIDCIFGPCKFGRGKFPCAKCKIECPKSFASIQCSVCSDWYHFACTDLTVKELKND